MTRFTGAGNKQATQNALQNDFALVGNFSLEDSFGGTVLAQNPGFPDVSQVLDDATGKLPNVFSPIPLADGWASGPMDYYYNRFKPLAHYAGAFLANSPSATQTWNGEKYVAEQAGFKFISEQTYATTQTDFTQQVIAMKNAGVKIVFMDQMPGNYASSVLKAMAQQNFHPQVLLGAATYSNALVSQSGGAANVDGVVPVAEPRPLPRHRRGGRPRGGVLPALGAGGLPRVQPRPLHRLRLAVRRPVRPGAPQRRLEPQPGFAAHGPGQGHVVQRRTGSTPRPIQRRRSRRTAT